VSIAEARVVVDDSKAFVAATAPPSRLTEVALAEGVAAGCWLLVVKLTDEVGIASLAVASSTWKVLDAELNDATECRRTSKFWNDAD